MRSSTRTARVDESQFDVVGRSGKPVGQAAAVKAYPVADIAQAKRIDAIMRQNLAAGFQAKLTVGQPNDVYEQEADRVAEQVMSMPDRQPAVQREGLPREEEELQTKSLGGAIQREAMPEEDEEIQAKPLSATITPLVQREAMPEEEEEIQAKSLGGAIQREAMPEEEEEPVQAKLIQREAMTEEEEPIQTKKSSDGGLEAGEDFESRLSRSKSGGSPLPDDVRRFMEPRFGADFSGVRVHTGSEAVQMNRAVNAQAFAHGQDVYYGAGKGPGKDALTAHELTHVLQQTDNVQSLQRRPTTVPAPFIGGSAFNDSSVTFTPRGAVWINGTETSSSDFSSRDHGSVQIRAGTTGVVQLNIGVSVFEDNLILNESWNQSFYVNWGVSADRRGNVTIEQTPMITVNPRDGSITQSSLQSVNPSQGSNYVMVNPTIQGSSGAGGISVGVGVETNYPGSFMQRPFRLNIEVTDIQSPEETVTIGPIRVLRNHEVLFERPRQKRVSTTQEGQLISWYNSLSQLAKDQIQVGGEPISLEGHASTTGNPAKNRELSNDRMEAVHRILGQFTGNRANFNTRSVGAYQATTGNNIEAAEERKVVVSVWEQLTEGESPAGGVTGPASSTSGSP
jgi:hypothetical protein